MNKGISVTPDVYEKLNNLRDVLGGKLSFCRVIGKLFEELEELEEKIEKADNRIIEIENDKKIFTQEIMKLIATPRMVIGNPTPVLSNPPPPPPKFTPPKKKKAYKPKNTGNLKKDFVNEMRQVFNGSFIKPSELLKITNPTHKDIEIKVLDEDFEEPDIYEIGKADEIIKRTEEENNIGV